MTTTKRILAALALATAGLPASAQSFGGLEDHRGAEAALFLRIPFGSSGSGPGLRSEAREAQFGLALNMGCKSSLAMSGIGLEACNRSPVRAVELAGGPSSNWTLSFSGAGRRTDLATWSPRTGILSFAGEDGGASDWLWITLGAAGSIALMAKLVDDGDFVLCSGDGATVSNDGTCDAD